MVAEAVKRTEPAPAIATLKDHLEAMNTDRAVAQQNMRHCRVKEAFKDSSRPARHLVWLGPSSIGHGLALALLEVLVKGGATFHEGTAPPTALERNAQKMLDKLEGR